MQKIPWAEEPGRLQSMGSLRAEHDWATSLSLFTFMHWRRKWQPTPVFLPGESQGWEPGGLPSMGSHSRTRLKRLSSSSSRKTATGFTCGLTRGKLGTAKDQHLEDKWLPKAQDAPPPQRRAERGPWRHAPPRPRPFTDSRDRGGGRTCGAGRVGAAGWF